MSSKDFLNAAKQLILDQPDALEKQVREEGGLNQKQSALTLFHYWMREKDPKNIKSGSIVDYRKYVAEYLDQDAELSVPDDLGNHKSAAVSKYEDFLESEFLENLSKKNGDSS